jgi:2-C-methyl-D-erythritol 2,4-cyclodiphosphate synthase
MRVGTGYDSHRFAPGRRLVLGGVEIPNDAGLAGHSDADAVTHAVIDALLGAAGLGDIGTHFPPTDERWRDADSLELLSSVVRMLEERNYQPVNVDLTVIAERPALAPYAGDMRMRLASVLGIEAGQVSVKAKSNESMGWIGRGEGLAVVAAVLIDSIEPLGGPDDVPLA